MKSYELSVEECHAAEAELSTLIDWVRWAVTQFNRADLAYGHGTENSWDEAFFLLLSLLKLPHELDQNLLHARLLTAEKRLLGEKLRLRINKRIPTAYLVNEAWFAGMSFYVDQRVIIPRSPIAELLVEKELSPWVEPESIERVLDLCTGSGCIAIASAMVFPDATVDAVDISEDALAVAAINVERYGLDETVKLIQSDLFHAIPNEKYDLIISNPPYVPRPEYMELAPEYQHEPQLSLEAGEDGLMIVHQILQQAARHLTPKGTLVVEVGDLKSTLEASYPDIPFTWLPCDQGGEGIFLLTATELREAGVIKPQLN